MNTLEAWFRVLLPKPCAGAVRRRESSCTPNMDLPFKVAVAPFIAFRSKCLPLSAHEGQARSDDVATERVCAKRALQCGTTSPKNLALRLAAKREVGQVLYKDDACHKRMLGKGRGYIPTFLASQSAASLAVRARTPTYTARRWLLRARPSCHVVAKLEGLPHAADSHADAHERRIGGRPGSHYHCEGPR